jgi:hypothetical protein
MPIKLKENIAPAIYGTGDIRLTTGKMPDDDGVRLLLPSPDIKQDRELWDKGVINKSNKEEDLPEPRVRLIFKDPRSIRVMIEMLGTVMEEWINDYSTTIDLCDLSFDPEKLGTEPDWNFGEEE